MAEHLDHGAQAAAEQKARKAVRDASRKTEAAEEPDGKKEILPPWERGAEGIALVDTHAHIDGEDYADDREEMLERAKRAGVVAVVTFGDTMEASARAVGLAASHDNIFAGVGVHPENAFPLTQEDDDRLAEWTKEKKIVAIGEIGLDYYWEKDEEKRKLQRKMFVRQLALARDLDLPVCIHDREAHSDLMTILKTEGRKNRGVIHCFSGSWEMAKELLKLGWYLGVDGPLTYKNAAKLPEIVQKMPADRLLVETDCPYLSPLPYRGKRNEPAYVRITAECAAEIRGESLADLASQTTKNACEIYGLKVEH
ncbi:MAG: TatD family hydrolase [Schwartzia sp.]|nr:TatD family hydrolase [Schwartzia sp. (in: firmicutes)]